MSNSEKYTKTKNLVEFHRFFYTPVWRYQYPDWEQDCEFFIRHLSRDNLYITERERNNLVITRANLHKDPALKRLADFIHECASSSMSIMGFQKSCAITSMWATRQKGGGFHHRHFHANAFLGASMAVFDSDGTSSGTIFDNMDIHKYGLHPAVDKDERLLLAPSEHLPFYPGSVLVFPAWAVHHTAPNNSTKRINIGANIVPVGATNHDHYDRYDFPHPDTMQLKEFEG